MQVEACYQLLKAWLGWARAQVIVGSHIEDKHCVNIGCSRRKAQSAVAISKISKLVIIRPWNIEKDGFEYL